jgi:hypothetical protein
MKHGLISVRQCAIRVMKICPGEILEMDTSNLDKQAKAHLAFYHNFMTASKIVTGLVILTLIIMAATLL